ncbi:MAG: cytidylate kinase-like family protein [Magnetococcales bacterium]|nr:cytidylate kinase-like family protein [Magnetococcales bacterium]
MNTDVGVRGLIKSAFFNPQRIAECDKEKKCPVVTVSRGYGANGSRTAELLADRLMVPCYGFTMVDGIIKEAKTNKNLMELMDEKYPSVMDDWLHSMLSKGDISRVGYHRRLIKTVLTIARTGGVIIGRGAHLILSNHQNVFRTRVEGSLETCSRRIAERDKIKQKKAREVVIKTNKERARFVRELYKRFPPDREFYDLVVNSDRITPEQSVEIMIHTMSVMGFHVPGEKKVIALAS